MQFIFCQANKKKEREKKNKKKRKRYKNENCRSSTRTKHTYSTFYVIYTVSAHHFTVNSVFRFVKNKERNKARGTEGAARRRANQRAAIE